MIAFNLARAIAVLTSNDTSNGTSNGTSTRPRWATLRRRLINIPARIATSGRQHTLHLPRGWPWEHGWQQLHTATTQT